MGGSTVANTLDQTDARMWELTPAPHIEQRWVCIAADDHTLLAAQLSSYFNDPAVYFAVFEFPVMERPYEEVPTRDGYFAQILGRRAATHINNCLAQLQPQKIIILGLSPLSQSNLRAILPAHLLVEVNTETELLALPFAKSSERLLCKPSQAIEGLLAAKAVNKALAFADDAPDLPQLLITGRQGLVLVENTAGIGEVATINYAASIDADVSLVDAVDRDELRSLPRDLQTWADDHSGLALRDTKRKITSRIKDIDFTAYKFATFFTAGLPYGLILENRILFTHVLNGPYCSVFLANAMLEEHLKPVGNALLFSLEDFAAEVNQVAQRLDQCNFLLTPLLGKAASNDNLTNYGSYVPYDLLHICSHGGETDGYFAEQKFVDRDGNEHVLTYFEVVSFSPEAAMDPNKIKVESKVIFVTFDGIAWLDRPLSLLPKYVGDDMIHAIKDESGSVQRTPVNVPIALSCHIQCYRSFHQGAFDFLAAHKHPIILNNSCSSSHELAASLLAAGARTYLGTLWPVGDKSATKAALAFYDAALAHGTVAAGFSAMLRAITNKKYQHIYILWGLHFTTFPKHAKKSDDHVIGGLLMNYSSIAKRLATTRDDELKRRILPIVRFLEAEIQRRATPERLLQFLAERLPGQEEVERSRGLADDPVEDEIVITKEIARPTDPTPLRSASSEEVVEDS